MADAKISRHSTESGVYAVTPFGHWRLCDQSELSTSGNPADNFAYKWGLPMTGGHAVVDVVSSINWWGPNLDKALTTITDQLDLVRQKVDSNGDKLDQLINGS